MPNHKGFRVQISNVLKNEIRTRYLNGETRTELLRTFPGAPSSLAHIVAGLKPQREEAKHRARVASLQKLSQLSVGWIAGIVDGEGWIGLTKYKARRGYLGPRLQVSSTTPAMQQRLLDQLGGNMSIRRRPKKNDRDLYVWQLWSLTMVRAVLVLITPHLIVKQQQAKHLLDFCHRHIGRSQKKLTKQDAETYRTLRRLNKRGRRGQNKPDR